ncbi:metal tolerance protein A1 isoform X2 [Diospyros lotus]|uniref:metal tolerance protein A1 isoform X2 n=1 Tax=Diospyros lotus TaxID=55363 RepID=UPI00224D8F6B|nr:metal tolerance protein A1 isoform X2 [Diospyros lotus]
MKMEHREDSSLRTEHPVHLEIEMKLTSEDDSGLPLPLQPSCNQVCAFSDREYISSPDERSKSLTKLCWLIIFYVMFMAVEVVGGTKANSLAVLTDAAHLVTDIAGFSISLFTVWASSWDATSQHSFGFKRLEVLGALLSVQLIWVICGVLIYEAGDRILHKTARVNGRLMFAIAALGFIINFIMVMWLGHGHGHGHGHSHCACTGKNHSHKAEELCARTDEEDITLVAHPQKDTERLNINLQGAYLHVMADMIQSVGVMLAGLIIWAKPKWFAVDLVCTLIFSIFALGSTAPMLRDILCILMERTPSDVDVSSLEIGLKCIKGVHDVHDLHVWAITVGKTVLSCHVIVEPGINPNELLLKIRDYCERTYSIHHVTVQIEQKV